MGKRIICDNDSLWVVFVLLLVVILIIGLQ